MSTMTFERRNVGSSACQPTIVDVDWRKGGWHVSNPHIDEMGNEQDGEQGVISTARNASVKTLIRKVMEAGGLSGEPKVSTHSNGFRLTFPG